VPTVSSGEMSGRGDALGSDRPVLRIFDEEKAKAFYVGYLGCAVDWEHRFEPDLPDLLAII